MRRAGSSLFFRTAITLALALIVFQAIALWVVYRTVIVPVAERSADDLAGLVVLSAQTWAELPPQTRPAFERELERRHGLTLTPDAVAADSDPAGFSFRREIEAALSGRIGQPSTLARIAGEAMVWVDIPVGEHELKVGFMPERYAVELPLAALAMIALGTLLSVLTALFIVRRITVPLARVAAAARQVGAGETPEPLPETGPSELVDLARRFNRMAEEVRDLLDNRSTLLAGISHDLRTPMTRLRLTLELMQDKPGPERITRALADLDAMNTLITGYLELARSARAEARASFDLAELLAVIAEETGAHWVVAAGAATPPCPVDAAPLALRQIVENLIQNAQRYAAGQSPELHLHVAQDSVRICVRDFGPGIPASELEKVFRPFYRIEASRSTATGGSGLGLAIARQLAESQGWRIDLLNRSEGGLDAVLEIQRA